MWNRGGGIYDFSKTLGLKIGQRVLSRGLIRKNTGVCGLQGLQGDQIWDRGVTGQTETTSRRLRQAECVHDIIERFG